MSSTPQEPSARPSPDYMADLSKAKGASWGGSDGRGPSRRTGLIAVAGAVVAVLLGIGVFLLLSGGDDDTAASTTTVADDGATNGGGGGEGDAEPTPPAVEVGEPTDDGGLAVSSDELGDQWPLSVDSGVLRCDDGAVTFESGGTVYSVDAEAQNRQLGEPLSSIWLPNPADATQRMSIAVLLDNARTLC